MGTLIRLLIIGLLNTGGGHSFPFFEGEEAVNADGNKLMMTSTTPSDERIMPAQYLLPPTRQANNCPRCPTPPNSCPSAIFDYINLYVQRECIDSLPLVINGYVEQFGSSLVGATRKVVCTKDGFDIRGPNIVVCNSNRKWTQPGVCEPIPPTAGPEFRCRIPHISSVGSYVLKAEKPLKVESGFAVAQNSIIGLLCPENYVVSGPVQHICANGYGWWPEDYGICIIPTITTPECPPLVPAPVNGFVHDGKNEIGAQRLIECYKQYRLRGNSSAICQADGTWLVAANCTIKECDDTVPELVNGLIRGVDRFVGAVRPLECNPGYLLDGEPTMTCQDNETWDLRTTCRPLIKCNTIIHFGNGIYSDGESNVGAERALQCNSGFHMKGEAKMRCEDEGTWKIFGHCEPEVCGAPPAIPHGILLGSDNGLAVGNVRYIRCNAGFRIFGPSRIACRENLTWTFPGICVSIWEVSTISTTIGQNGCGHCVLGTRTNSSKLLEAVRAGDTAQVVKLLGKCADPDYQDEKGLWTALMLAANKGNANLVKSLLLCNASVNLRNAAQSTALMFASKSGSKEAVKMILEAGANANAANIYGSTPLLFAVQSGNIDVVRMLLNSNANTTAVDVEGNTALAWATRDNQKTIALVLLEHGADPNLLNNNNQSCLMIAAKSGYLEVAKELLNYGADVTAVDVDGRNAFDYANDHEQQAILDLLASQTTPTTRLPPGGGGDDVSGEETTLETLFLEPSQSDIVSVVRNPSIPQFSESDFFRYTSRKLRDRFIPSA